jgi:hypothetical protein
MVKTKKTDNTMVKTKKTDNTIVKTKRTNGQLPYNNSGEKRVNMNENEYENELSDDEQSQQTMAESYANVVQTNLSRNCMPPDVVCVKSYKSTSHCYTSCY